MATNSNLKSIPATVIKRLGNQAPEFDLPVSFPRLDGTVVQITFRANAIRKTVWAAKRDERERAVFLALVPTAQPEPVAPADGEDVPAGGDAVEPQTETDKVVSDALARIEKHGVEANMRKGIDQGVKLVLEFATGWDLEDPFNAEALAAMEDEFGGSIAATISAYDMAIYQGRLGNSLQ